MGLASKPGPYRREQAICDLQSGDPRWNDETVVAAESPLDQCCQHLHSVSAHAAREERAGESPVFPKVLQYRRQLPGVVFRAQRIRESLEYATKALGEKGILGRKVLIEGGAADSRTPRDVIDRDVLVGSGENLYGEGIQ